VSGEEQDDVTLQVSADVQGELMLHVIATGPGQLFVDGRLMTSWRRPCTSASGAGFSLHQGHRRIH
jgi:hypothetical protein